MNTRGRGVHQSGDSHRRCELRQQHFYQGRLQALVYVAPACVCVYFFLVTPRSRDYVDSAGYMECKRGHRAW